MSDLELENWDPLGPRDAAKILERLETPCWIAGGFAIDAFVGRFDRRPHEDLDVGLLARDQEALRAQLAGWELYCADPPGTLRPWLAGEHLEEPIHDVWCRPRPGDPWRLALVLNPSEDDLWLYRRDIRIRRPLSGLTFERDGIRYAAPEVQLLFKSKGLRAKDEQDFTDAGPLLDAEQRSWLRKALELTQPGHPWLARL